MKTFNKGFVYFICIVSAMGGLLFGYDWVVIGGAKPFYEVYFNIADDPGMQGLAMSIALMGCLTGAMTAGSLADRFGRKSCSSPRQWCSCCLPTARDTSAISAIFWRRASSAAWA